MRLGSSSFRVDWGHVAFATAMAVVTVVYFFNVLSVSRNINNIILVVPLALFLVGLYLALLAKSVRPAVSPQRDDVVAGGSETESSADAQEGAGQDIGRAAVLLACLGLYVGLYETIGLDVATFAFMCAGLMLLGVKGRVFVPLYAAIFTVIVVGGADLLLHYPMYTAILP